jgi:hypothetical protein
MPPLRADTTGSPEAIASVTTCPAGSCHSTGMQKMSAAP